MDLDAWSACLRVLSDPTRVRLLALLERDELTVAELAAITRLAQPRVSTHLAKLKEHGLVRDRRAGVSAYYRFAEDDMDAAQRALWKALSDGADDALLPKDAMALRPEDAPHTRVEFVPGGAHYLVDDNPEEVTRRIADFVLS